MYLGSRVRLVGKTPAEKTTLVILPYTYASITLCYVFLLLHFRNKITMALMFDKGYKNDFVKTPNPPEYFKCGLCHFVLREPQLTECCGRSVCQPCIETYIKNRLSCPMPSCGKPQVNVSLQRKLKNDIIDSEVYCTNKREGCKWTGKLNVFETHYMTDCGFVTQECVYGCGLKLERRNAKEHENTCPNFVIKCPLCDETLVRSQYLCHSEVCLMAEKPCAFNLLGCTHKALLKDLTKHYDTSAYPLHLELVSKQTQNVQRLLEEKYQAMRSAQNKMTHQLDAEISILAETITAQESKMAVVAQKLHATEQELRLLQQAQRDKAKHLTALLNENIACTGQLRPVMAALQFESKVKCYGPPRLVPNNVITSRPLACSEAVDLPITFAIRDFPDKKDHDMCVHSPPFYTSRYGYKLCLRIYCNGCTTHRNTHLSIFACLMKGQFDDNLRWPFSGTLTVTVSNAASCNIVFDRSTPSESKSRVYEDDKLGVAFGCGEVIVQKILFKSSLLFGYEHMKNNSLNVSVASC